MNQDRAAFIQYRGIAGDRNPFGMTGAAILGNALAKRFDIEPVIVGTPQMPSGNQDSASALHTAFPDLRRLADTYEKVLVSARSPVTVMGRCASGLATLPVIARLHHNAKIVWFDAHGDLNTPLTSSSGYLGGMVLSGCAGLWETGLGSGLNLSNIILVGARDLDPAEQELIDKGAVRQVAPGADLCTRLQQAVGKGPVYIHIDCDVLNPGVVPTEFRVDNGLSAAELAEACETLTAHSVVGLEVAEFQSHWADSGVEASPQPIVDAVASIIKKILAG